MPDAIERMCAGCGEPLEPIMVSLGLMSHPGCSVDDVVETQTVPTSGFDDSAVRTGYVPLPDLADDLAAELSTMIRWHDENQPRSQQISLGPSDLGIECQRQLGYKIAGIRGFNHGDPLPGFVGSSLHARLEDVIKAYAKDYGERWMIERRVHVTPLISGSADLVRPPLVLDIKSAGKDVIDKARKEGPSAKYLTQINLYAYGLNREGIKIDQVALAFVPRAGWLKDVYVWAAPYDEKIARKALERLHIITESLRAMNIMDNPARWEQVPATPGFGCQWCSHFNKEMGPNEPATDKMCAGWNIKRGK